MTMGLGLSLGLATRRVAFSPLAILAGSYGAWYDPSDLSTMFQDIAATTPVTTDGQSVLRINDKSGNGLHLTQAVGAMAPLYKTNSVQQWLQFNGTTQFMSRLAVDLSPYSKISMFAGLYKNADDAVRFVCEHGPNASTTAGTFNMRSPTAASTSAGFQHFGATATQVVTISSGTAPTALNVTGLSDLQAPSVQIRANGTASAVSTTNVGGGNFSNQTFWLGSRIGTSLFFSGRLYQMIYVMRAATADEIAQAEAWCRAKAGL